MRMVLNYGGGQRVEGLLLAASLEQMRVVIPGQWDTVELSRQDGRWVSERGESVEIEALTAVEGLDSADILAGLAPRTMGAGGSF